MVRAEVSGKGVSVNDLFTKIRLEAVHAARSTVVWNTNDLVITNRSNTNAVATETYAPGRTEQEFRESAPHSVPQPKSQDDADHGGSKTGSKCRHSGSRLQE